jgi:hypothetical protein
VPEHDGGGCGDRRAPPPDGDQPAPTVPVTSSVAAGSAESVTVHSTFVPVSTTFQHGLDRAARSYRDGVVGFATAM